MSEKMQYLGACIIFLLLFLSYLIFVGYILLIKNRKVKKDNKQIKLSLLIKNYLGLFLDVFGCASFMNLVFWWKEFIQISRGVDRYAIGNSIVLGNGTIILRQSDLIKMVVIVIYVILAVIQICNIVKLHAIYKSEKKRIEVGKFVYCTSCGTPMPKEKEFCSNCGASLILNNVIDEE